VTFLPGSECPGSVLRIQKKKPGPTAGRPDRRARPSVLLIVPPPAWKCPVRTLFFLVVKVTVVVIDKTPTNSHARGPWSMLLTGLWLL